MYACMHVCIYRETYLIIGLFIYYIVSLAPALIGYGMMTYLPCPTQVYYSIFRCCALNNSLFVLRTPSGRLLVYKGI